MATSPMARSSEARTGATVAGLDAVRRG
jgi:hypothetical protein